jgi:hypothetical protein
VTRGMKAWGVVGAAMLVTGCVVAVLAASGGASTGKAAGGVSLKGTWSGHRERIAATEGYRTGKAKLTVTQQRGLTFKGTLTRYNADGNVTEPLVGALTPGGALVAGADEEGFYSFRLIDSTTLDFCYMENGKGYRTTCARLRKHT